MTAGRLRVALLGEVFPTTVNDLVTRLSTAKDRGAELVLLPEIPLDPWWPETDRPSDEAAEEPGGLRHRRLAAAAREVGIAVVGGAIVKANGVRRNTALVLDAGGELVGTYAKVHLPDEPGFFETAHYAPGHAPPEVISAFGLPFGLQICSDIQRPTGCELLAAKGAAAILHPRATERATWSRWRRVLVAAAQTSACWIVSVSRPGLDESDVMGGPTLVVRPDGEVEVESDDALVVVELDAAAAAKAREAYPGYLERDTAFYARAWGAV